MNEHARLLLITGGSGFIGQHCAREALRRGFSVVIVDLKPGQLRAPNLRYIQCDARDSSAFASELKTADAIIHLAATVNVKQCETELEVSYANNVMTTIALRSAIRSSTKKQRFVFASSAAVYGDLGHAQASEDSPTSPLSNYGLQKLFSERFLFQNEHPQLSTIVLRFFNVFGPGMDRTSPYSGVIEIFMRACEENRPLTIRGSGEQTRDFVYVGDVARAVVDAATSDSPGGVFNVASGRAMTVNELADMIESIYGRPFFRRNEEFGGFEIMHSRGDSRKIQTVLGWQSEANFGASLRITRETRS
ncbi:MAG: NAD-dependent epimerase/dehydratase family protein [Bdellovibrionaceae bacterium]|nr:NAD-dependent epimerase/dehydratase family protein [Pseudobdellovibrionaceae bacterium]